MTDAMRSGLGPSICGVLDCIEVAMAEIERAGLQDDREILGYLVTPAILRGKNIRIYEAHARELVARRKDGAKDRDLRRMTRAEILMALCAASIRQPLNHTGMLVYCRIYEEIMGELPAGMEQPHEAWKGQLDEELGRLYYQPGDRPGIRRTT